MTRTIKQLVRNPIVQKIMRALGVTLLKVLQELLEGAGNKAAKRRAHGR